MGAPEACQGASHEGLWGLPMGHRRDTESLPWATQWPARSLPLGKTEPALECGTQEGQVQTAGEQCSSNFRFPGRRFQTTSEIANWRQPFES
eukprot:1642695-Alexandrium_andersonii.AAC.1